jgi:hypothetical protein
MLGSHVQFRRAIIALDDVWDLLDLVITDIIHNAPTEGKNTSVCAHCRPGAQTPSSPGWGLL